MLQMSAETEAWWRAVPGYARSFCEKVPGLDPPPSPRSQPNTASLLSLRCVFLG